MLGQHSPGCASGCGSMFTDRILADQADLQVAAA
jgi:hypothetical protein